MMVMCDEERRRGLVEFDLLRVELMDFFTRIQFWCSYPTPPLSHNKQPASSSVNNENRRATILPDNWKTASSGDIKRGTYRQTDTHLLTPSLQSSHIFLSKWVHTLLCTILPPSSCTTQSNRTDKGGWFPSELCFFSSCILTVVLRKAFMSLGYKIRIC